MADWISGNSFHKCDDEEQEIDFVDLNVEVIAKTDKALLVRVDGGERQGWVPLSLISDDSDLNGKSFLGDNGIISIPEWLACEKEWV